MMLLTILLSSSLGLAEKPCLQDKHATSDLHRFCDAVIPRCFEAPSGLKGSSHPEALIRDLFAELSEEEIQARLVFAESLATQPECITGPQRTAIPQGIAWVLANRVRDEKKRYGTGVRDVVFRKAQFRSSFGGCDVATRAHLLCPSKAGDGWQDLWKSSVQAVQAAQANENNPMPQARHYFFGEHFKNSQDQCKKWHGVMPAWSKPPNKQLHPEIDGLEKDSRCAMFYDVKD